MGGRLFGARKSEKKGSKSTRSPSKKLEVEVLREGKSGFWLGDGRAWGLEFAVFGVEAVGDG